MKRAKIFFALILGLCMLPAIAGAEIYPVTKTELVNVAEFKPITSSDIHAIPDYPISNLTDGDRGTFMMSECGPEGNVMCA